MNETAEKKRFILPPQNVFQPNGKDDPLPYYYNPSVGWLYRARIEQGLSLLEPKYENILEIGFGSGIVLPSLCRLGEKVHGIDLESDPERVQESLKEMGCQCTLLKGDISTAEFSNSSFDLVVAFSILEHIHDLGMIMDALQTIITPGGHLLIGMPRVDTFMAKAFKIIGFRNIENHHVSTRADCIDAGRQHFLIEKSVHLPTFFPESAALYYNMLFRKR